jgi:uncharacterized tellurite resistance protein B-like protein
MKNQEFKKFLFKSAVMTMACDGNIAEEEISEIKNMVFNEIYFMGFDYEDLLKDEIEDIKVNGKVTINQYLQELNSIELNEHQEILLVEVILKIIEADNEIQTSEIKFLQLVKSKLKTDEQTLIIKFPKQIDYLIDFNNYGLSDIFTEEIDIKKLL